MPICFRLKKKDEDPPRVERELSDAYIDSISRTPRYTRHNTYDDMLNQMDAEDPFTGDYRPSGKSPKLGRPSKPPRSKKNQRAADMEDEKEFERSRPKKKSHKKKSKKDQSLENTAESYTNKAYKGDMDEDSVKSNGTYTLAQKSEVRTSLTNMAAPVLKKKPTKVKSLITEVSKREEMDNVSSMFLLQKKS